MGWCVGSGDGKREGDGGRKWVLKVEVDVTVKTLNIGTPRPATVVVLNIKQFNFTRK